MAGSAGRNDPDVQRPVPGQGCPVIAAMMQMKKIDLAALHRAAG
jgi:hypothetical protein